MRQKGFTPVIVLLIVLFSTLGYFMSKWGYLSFIKPIFTSKISPTSSVDVAKEQQKKWTLKKKVGKEEQIIFRLYSLSDPRILRWEDWIIWVDSSHKYVFAYNLKTQAKKTILEQNPYWGFISIKIIGTDLFMTIVPESMGQARSSEIFGSAYWISLPPDGTPNKIEGSKGGAIVKDNDNKYWLVNTDFDLCFLWQDLYSLDTNSKKVEHVTTTKIDFGSGEEFIAVYQAKKIIAAKNTGGCTPENIDSGFRKGDGYFTKLYAIPVENTSKTEVLIDEETMPKGITKIKYSAENNNLILYSKTSSYLFDLVTNKLKKNTIFPPLPTPKPSTLDSWKNHVKEILKMVKGLNLPSEYQFTLE